MTASVLDKVVREILDDMNAGACGKTITQTAQIVALTDGRKAAVQITVTTDPDHFL